MGYELDVLETHLKKRTHANPGALTLLQFFGVIPFCMPQVVREYRNACRFRVE